MCKNLEGKWSSKLEGSVGDLVRPQTVAEMGAEEAIDGDISSAGCCLVD